MTPSPTLTKGAARLWPALAKGEKTAGGRAWDKGACSRRSRGYKGRDRRGLSLGRRGREQTNSPRDWAKIGLLPGDKFPPGRGKPRRGTSLGAKPE